MIRREQLAASVANDSPDVAGEAADRVKRGEAVRIVGLGTLVMHDQRETIRGADCVGPDPRYRLTLTAAVAKATARLGHGQFFYDTQCLARALGAPVEVWAPEAAYRGMAEHKGPRLITTVQP